MFGRATAGVDDSVCDLYRATCPKDPIRELFLYMTIR